MLIMHVIPGDLWAGAESQVYSTIRVLNRLSVHEVAVVLFNKKELYKRLDDDNVTIHVIDEETNNSFVLCSKIKNLIVKICPDVVHVHEYKSHILTVFAKLLSGSNCKIVRTLHGQTASPFSIKYIKVFIILLLEKILLRYLTDYNIAVSKDIEYMLKRKYKNTRICQINNAVHMPLEVNIDSTDTRIQFGVGVNTFWLGTAARLVGVKNLDMLISAAKILKEKNVVDFKVSIFGEGPLEKTLQQKIDLYDLKDNVYLHGHNNDLLPVLTALDVFVLTSFNEGLPMSLLEAMSVGTVPVCTKVGGMKEVIEESKSGYLVESNNASQLADVLLFLYNNKELRVTFGNNAKNRVREKYSMENNVKTLLGLYESL